MLRAKAKIFVSIVLGVISIVGMLAFSTEILAAPLPIVAVPFSPDDNLDNPGLRMPAAGIPVSLGAPRLEEINLSTLDTVAAAVVSRLVALQSTTDAGWDWDIAALNAHSGAASPLNIYGGIALGLANASKMLRNTAYLDAARLVGDKLKTFIYQQNQKLQAPDLVFLHYLSKITGDATYRAKGSERLTQLKTPVAQGGLGYDTGAKLYAFYNNLPSVDPAQAELLRQLKHWQLASWAEAAYLYGEKTWADQIIIEIIKEQGAVGGFYYEPAPAKRYVRTIGQAKVLQVLGQFGYKTYTNQISRGVEYLKSLQATTGAVYSGATDNGVDTLTPWDIVLVQDQALTVMGLAQNLLSSNVADLQKALSYLITNLKVDRTVGSGFVDGAGKEYSEHNGEALLAMYFATKIGDVDGSGIITAGDALEVLKYSVILTTPPNGGALVGADRDCSGAISAGDALIILKNSVGRFNERPEEVVCQ